MAKPQIGICSYCVLDRPVFEWDQVLLHPELTLWWSLIFADGAHHKKPHSPTHPKPSMKNYHLRDGLQLSKAVQLGQFCPDPVWYAN